MQIIYDNKDVQNIIEDKKLLKKKVGIEIGKGVIKRLKQLEATDNFNEYLTKIGLGRPHKLIGNFEGCYAISITANYRLIVEPLAEKLEIELLKNSKKINIKGVVEYHGGKNEWIIP